MKIIIDIPECFYEYCKAQEDAIEIQLAVANGIPLPEGHGRLIDVSDIEWAKHQEEKNYIDYEVIDWDDIVNAPTIIEAESEE